MRVIINYRANLDDIIRYQICLWNILKYKKIWRVPGKNGNKKMQDFLPQVKLSEILGFIKIWFEYRKCILGTGQPYGLV